MWQGNGVSCAPAVCFFRQLPMARLPEKAPGGHRALVGWPRTQRRLPSASCSHLPYCLPFTMPSSLRCCFHAAEAAEASDGEMPAVLRRAVARVRQNHFVHKQNSPSDIGYHFHCFCHTGCVSVWPVVVLAAADDAPLLRLPLPCSCCCGGGGGGGGANGSWRSPDAPPLPNAPLLPPPKAEEPQPPNASVTSTRRGAGGPGSMRAVTVAPL